MPPDPIADEQLRLEGLSNSWRLGGVARTKGEVMTLEGTHQTLTSAQMLEAHLALRKEYPHSLSEAEFAHIQQVLERGAMGMSPTKAADIAQQYSASGSASVHSGTFSHSVEVSFEGDYMFISNKGLGTRAPIEAFRIDRSKVTQERILTVQSRMMMM